MKTMPTIILCTLLCACHNQSNMDNSHFTAQRFSQTATFTANGKINDVFALFGPFEEKKWADGWNPAPVYPAQGNVEEGLVFKTKGHVHGEKENVWTVAKYQPENHLIQYLVIAENRLLSITVRCSKMSDTATSASVTYTFTGLSDEGNQLSQHVLHKMYADNLNDWARAINYYLKTGQVLKQ